MKILRSAVTTPLFDEHVRSVRDVNPTLAVRHYLGPIARGWAWESEEGVMVFGNPSSRRLPQDRWVELLRWCLLRNRPNDGSRQWSQFVKWARRSIPEITTVVSYSDPSAGHSGALYKACNWLWRPTWHRLKPPPTGNGSWDGKTYQSVKDRWIFELRPDADRDRLTGGVPLPVRAKVKMGPVSRTSPSHAPAR